MKKNNEISENNIAESKYEILLNTLRIGSISKAAEQLNYTQSGLTYTLNALESDLGVSILSRDHKGVSLTEEGAMLEPYLQAVIDAEHELRNRIRDLIDSDSTRIRIGTIQTIAKYCLPRIIVEFTQLYPNADITFMVSTGTDINQKLQKKELDIGIMDAGNAGSLESIHLQEEDIYIYVPAAWDVPVHDGKVSLDDLLDRPILYHSNPKSAGVMVMKNKPMSKKIMVSYDGDTILSMVNAGMGFSMLSKRFASDCPEDVDIYPADPPITRNIAIVVNSLKELHPLTRKFIKYLGESTILHNDLY